MKAGKICRIFVVFLCMFLWQNPLRAQNPTPTATPETNTQSENELNLIHLGDLIDVDVLGSFEYDWRGTLNNEGFLAGLENLESQVFALCRSEEQLASEIAKAYGKFL